MLLPDDRTASCRVEVAKRAVEGMVRSLTVSSWSRQELADATMPDCLIPYYCDQIYYATDARPNIDPAIYIYWPSELPVPDHVIRFLRRIEGISCMIQLKK